MTEGAATTASPPREEIVGEAVRLTELRKSYGAIEAVKGVDLSVQRGEVVALLGPNGAGKTTTISMLLGLLQPTTGSVALFGQPPKRAIAEGRVGAVLQYAEPLDGVTVAELVRAVGDLYTASRTVEDVLEAAGIADLAGRRTDKLSGGQKQRVRFALALVANPDLLVLDEPTSAMDVAARRTFWAAVRAYAETGGTVLFSTHYLEEADENADRIVLIAAGRVVADGPVTQIKAVASARMVRATLDAPASHDMLLLPGVQSAEVHGQVVTLRCTDADIATRALLDQFPDARDLEVRAAPLTEAILQLTAEGDQ